MATGRRITHATHPPVLDRRQQQPQVARAANLALSERPQEVLEHISQIPGWIRQRGLTFIVVAGGGCGGTLGGRWWGSRSASYSDVFGSKYVQPNWALVWRQLAPYSLST